MDLIDQIKVLATKIPKLSESIKTEEGTKKGKSKIIFNRFLVFLMIGLMVLAFSPVLSVTSATTNSALSEIQEGSSSSGDSSNSSGGSDNRGSSSGSGGAGGSPESQSNVEIKELSQTFVSSGKAVKFDFPQKATPVVCVSFDSKKTAGKTTTIAEMLKNQSTLVSGLPSDEVYKSINIWVGNNGFATPDNIENAVVDFKVEKSWIQDKNIDKSSITLNRFNDIKWNALPSNLSGEDEKYLYFAAKTPALSSPFAITGKIAASEAVNATQSETNTKITLPIRH